MIFLFGQSRAARKRERAVARLANAQARAVRTELKAARDERREAHRAEKASLPWWRQPTVGTAVAAWQRDH